MQNQTYKRSVADMIKTRNPAINSPNYVDHNDTVTVSVSRSAGCYVEGGYKDFVLDSESIDVFAGAGAEASCRVETCDDGMLRPSRAECTSTRVMFDCQVKGDNAGCRKTASCPSQKRIVGAAAACNLEYGSVSDDALQAVSPGRIKVLKASDKVSDGICNIHSTSLRSGEKKITDLAGLTRVAVGFKEHDKNRGDCHIKGRLYCQ
jgi:hypothetical protein